MVATRRGAETSPNASDNILIRPFFRFNAPFTFGNAPRIMPNLYGPGALNVDISLFKNAQISEKFQLQFRAEAFNVFDRVQFANPATNINQSTFGRITAQANSPRDIQLAIKLLF